MGRKMAGVEVLGVVVASAVMACGSQGSHQPPPPAGIYYVALGGNDAWSGQYDAPTKDGHDGPFATIDRARQAVQAAERTGLTSIDVQVRAGTYYLAAMLAFTAADSGTATVPITYEAYPGETPVVSGGVRVTGWTNTSGNRWTVTLPATTTYFENLYYNGARRLRPRASGPLGGTPWLRVAGTYYAAAQSANCNVEVTAQLPGPDWECFDRFYYTPGDVSATWKNLVPGAGNPCGQPAGTGAPAGDIELVNFEQFTTSRERISCIDPVSHVVYLTGPTSVNKKIPSQSGYNAGNRYLVDNVQDELTSPGQWFLDRSTTPWTLTYLANPGEDPNTDTVVIPQLSQVVVASALSNVTFRGLTFAHDNFTVPPEGHASRELEPDIPGAVAFQNARAITIDGDTLTQISGTGLTFESCVDSSSPSDCVSQDPAAVTSDDLIENSAIYDVGANGLRIGAPFVPSDTDANVPQRMTVQNNVVEGYGRTFPAAFGLAAGLAHDNLFTHNDVYDGYHCAISLTEQAGDNEMENGIGNANNTVSFNHVHDLLQGIMNDGGSIRIESGNAAFTAAGNRIINNKIHDVTDASALDPTTGYGGDGIYLDNSTGAIDIENNLVYRVSDNAVYTPHGPGFPSQPNIVKNNILAFARLGMIANTNPYSDGVPTAVGQEFAVSNNLMVFDRNNNSAPKFFLQGGCTYAAGVASFAAFQAWRSNLFFEVGADFSTEKHAFHLQANASTTSKNPPCSPLLADWTFFDVATWMTMQSDTATVIKDPGFANAAADDFSLPAGSPGADFVVFDASQDGRTTATLQPPAVAPTFATKTFAPADF